MFKASDGIELNSVKKIEGSSNGKCASLIDVNNTYGVIFTIQIEGILKKRKKSKKSI